jgi:hypothetical protein
VRANSPPTPESEAPATKNEKQPAPAGIPARQAGDSASLRTAVPGRPRRSTRVATKAIAAELPVAWLDASGRKE